MAELRVNLLAVRREHEEAIAKHAGAAKKLGHLQSQHDELTKSNSEIHSELAAAIGEFSFLLFVCHRMTEYFFNVCDFNDYL